MTEMAQWLAVLGLEKYIPAFEAAKIDFAAFRDLSENDLKTLRLPVGPRRRILAARAASALPDAGAPTAAPERRHLTLMFVDLVGSTALSVQNDPEITSGLLGAYKDIVTREVIQSGGTVAKYLGDGVLAYFGWPHAREDAAECGIRCALGITEHVKTILAPDGTPLLCRIGLATGLVVVGGMAGAGYAREEVIAGKSLNLAARLQSLAAPGAIVMDTNTHRLVGRIFDCETLGGRKLDGFDFPVSAWRVKGVSPGTDRFSATRVIRTALFGRAAELAMLMAQWNEAEQGAGQAILIGGEAGIGKSRLADALRRHIAGTPHSFVRWQASVYHQNNALYPIIDYLINAANILASESPQTRLTKIADFLAAAQLPLQRALPFFADLLSIPPEAGYIAAEMPQPAQRRAALIEALNGWILRIAEIRPVFLLLEDAHWLDATTLELMAQLIPMAGLRKILIVITGRENRISELPQANVLTLDRLQNGPCEDLVRALDTGQELQQSSLQQIVEKGDGNPLFLEEISLAVLEKKSPQRQLIPDTLQGSLMSRLDQLGEAKRTAQICAVLGRRFTRPFLRRISELAPETLDANLNILVARDIIHQSGRSGDDEYEFKHALVRDAAYNSLLLSYRRRLHERCAETLEHQFPDAARTEPELLAYHFSQAGFAPQATKYFEMAGDRAAGIFGFTEAIANYREAIRNNELTAAGLARDRRALALLLKLGPALGIINGAQDSEVGETYRQAEAISASLDDVDGLFNARWGQWYNANIGRDFARAAQLAEELVVLSRRSARDAHRLEALHCRWSSGLFSGSYAKASADAERGTALYDREKHHRLGLSFGGHDPGVCACGVRGKALIILGRIGEGLAWAEKGVSFADELSHPQSTAHGLMLGAIAAAIARDHAVAHRYAQQLRAVAEKYNFPPQKSISHYLLGWAEAQAGSVGAGLGQMAAAFEHVVRIGPMPLFFAALYAGQLLQAGRAEEAWAAAARAIQLHSTDTGLYLSELYRLRGDAVLALGRKAEAVDDIARADAIAQRQGAHLFQLRTAASRLRLQAGSAAETQARAALHAALERLSDSESSADFADAQALLGA